MPLSSPLISKMSKMRGKKPITLSLSEWIKRLKRTRGSPKSNITGIWRRKNDCWKRKLQNTTKKDSSSSTKRPRMRPRLLQITLSTWRL